MTNIFEGMTNLYSLSKTLRFELKPVGKTLENIKKNEILIRDEQRDKDYPTIKLLFDTLHNKFIKESLEQLHTTNREDFSIFYKEYKKKIRDKKNLATKEVKDLDDELQNRLLKLRKEVCALYTTTAELRKTKVDFLDEKGNSYFKEKGYKILTENGVLNLLQKQYKGTPEEKIIKRFEGFFTYFGGFNQNRENYYTHEDKSTAVAYRIVNQNFLTFCNNIELSTIVIEKLGDRLSEKDKEIFIANNYNRYLTQEGINIYNAIIGGETDINGKRISDGIKQKVNEYNQKLSKGDKKIPQLKQLYKQIGSQIEKSIPFTLIETPEELKYILKEFLETSGVYNKEITNLMHMLFQQSVEGEKIWISKTALNIISNKYFANWFTIQEKALEIKIFTEDKKKNVEEKIKIPAYISLEELKKILQSLEYTHQDTVPEDQKIYLFKKHFEEKRNGETDNWIFFLKIIKEDFEKLFTIHEEVTDEKGKKYKYVGYNTAKQDLEEIINSLDKENQDHKNRIKYFTDSCINILRFIKLFTVKDESKDKDYDFYNTLEYIIIDYPATKWYDAIRNYLTKKPFSEEKIKLNFDSSTLLAGWDKNQETQNLCVLLKDKEKFYLAIMKKDNNKFFRDSKILYETDGGSGLEKMEYKQMALPMGFGAFMRKCFGTATKLGRSCPENCLNNEGKIIIKEDEVNSLEELIDCYKDFLNKYEKDGFAYKEYHFNFKESSEYKNLREFYHDVELQGYKISWTPINKEYLFQQADEGNIYLFEISSKDFYKKDTTTSDNLQTIYWRNIFIPGSNVKLNGEAEVFYRKGSINEKKKIITKKKQQEIQYHDKQGKLQYAHQSQRYIEDKILFHVPITLGFGNKGGAKFNQNLNQKILQNFENIKVIGIDRGEKHLAFYSIVDFNGKIVEQGTLNIVEGINYEEKLSEKAKTRLEARQNRDTIGNIKNLKEGYIGQVVRRIIDLMIRHNAMVVFEDLNGGFKRGRQKIEQSVYQKLELALAKKLNFLVNKNTPLEQPGSATHAYQLTPPISTFGDIKGKQRGMILYTRANYTSQTDPITGFRKNLYLKNTTRDDMKKQIESFDALGFDTVKGAYFFSYNPIKFTEGKGTNNRTVRSCVDRFRGNKNKSSGQWEVKKINVTENLDKLFSEYHIIKNGDILSQLKSRSDLSSGFYSSLIWNFDVIIQIRNSGEASSITDLISDFIHSPIEPFFDSRIYKAINPDETENTIERPTSGDANGAYNIARKGVMMIKRIKDNPEKPDLYISDEQWDNELQKKHI